MGLILPCLVRDARHKGGGRATDDASLATLVLFSKLIDTTTLINFGEKWCRKNLTLEQPK